jgi:aminoglycoside phosphotransferase (APT) family kinase protein
LTLSDAAFTLIEDDREPPHPETHPTIQSGELQTPVKTFAALAEGLRFYFASTGSESDVEILEMLSGGWSVNTYRVQVGGRELVLRRADAEHPLQTNAAREARIMRHAGAAGVPVPEVLVSEEDPSWLGAPFSLVELIAGTAPIVWSRRRMQRVWEAIAPEELLRQLIDLTLQIQGVSLDATAEPASSLGMGVGDYDIPADVSRWRAMLSTTVKPRPVLQLAGRWLAENAPPDRDVVFQHHDFRLGNLLVDDAGRAAAVIDWEFSGAGDPLCDIGYAAQPYTLGKLLTSDGYIGLRPDPSSWLKREYIERTEPAIDHERLDWFIAFGIFKMAVALVVPADRWWRDCGTDRDAWLELPILSLSQDLIAAIRNLP